jgi:DNA adenine methylase
MSKFQPAIKWSGSKRSQSALLLSKFPKEIKTYYEPFCGGCSMLRALLDSDIKVDNYICSDINNDLIDLWCKIKESPQDIITSYEKMWKELNVDDDTTRKKEYFYSVRKRFNEFKNPDDFMFIMRTTTNGMPRYNLKGNFNNSFHITRNGIIPKTLKKVILEWSKLLNDNNVQFKNISYSDITSIDGDFLYLDPPYANTKGMYYGAIDYDNLWHWMVSQNAEYILSFDGISGEEDNTFSVPKKVYSTHEYILSGNSSFKRTIGKSNDSIVYESLYIK